MWEDNITPHMYMGTEENKQTFIYLINIFSLINVEFMKTEQQLPHQIHNMLQVSI